MAAGKQTKRRARRVPSHVEVMPLVIIACMGTVAFGMYIWRGAADIAPSLHIVAPGGVSGAATPHVPPPTHFAVPPLKSGTIARSWQQDGDKAFLQRPDGSRLALTLNTRAQRGVEKLLADRGVSYAAVVMVHAKTGAVQVWADHIDTRDEAGAGHSLTGTRAPAASVFKIVTTAALLEAGVAPSETTCFHGGASGITAWHIKPRPKFDKRCQTLTEALARSSNVVFARRTLKHLAVGALTAQAHDMLFDKAIPFDVSGSKSRFREGSSELRRARAAAGFIGANLSPLHAAVIGAALANSGIAMRPHLVTADTLQPDRERTPEELGQLVTPEHAASLMQMLATTPVDGTARRAFRRWPDDLAHIGVAGKTGSLNGKGSKTYRHYSWFVGAAPVTDPEIGFAVLAVNGERGRAKATDLARDALAIYFADRRFKPVGPEL